MSFVAYHKDTTRYLMRHKDTKTNQEFFVTKSNAKAAITREAKRGVIVKEDFLVAETSYFHDNIEKTHMVRSAFDGKICEERVNTPYVCSVGSDAYWQS